jgi:ribosomal protein S18 acetylase RimI-like enzyme
LIEFSIEPIRELQEDTLKHLLFASEAEGFKFVRRVIDQWRSRANRFDDPGEWLVTARVEGAVVGICGLMLDPYVQATGVGRLRNLYVLPEFRRAGIGEALCREVVRLAAARFRTLRLRAGTPQASRLYDRLGFTPVRGVADCTHSMECR